MQDIKNAVIEGWLKKKKSSGSKNFFSKFTKRWFNLDVKNAVFSYSSAKNKKSKKLIPLRELINVETEQVHEGSQVKEWGHEFTVITQERVYHLFCQTKEDKDMWVEAFKALVEYKNKPLTEEEPKKKKKKKSKKKAKQDDDSVELDIDKIFKKGPHETVQLEPPSPGDNFQPVEADFNSKKMGESSKSGSTNGSFVNRQLTVLQDFSFTSKRKLTEESSGSNQYKFDRKYGHNASPDSDQHTKISSEREVKVSSGEHSQLEHARPSGSDDQEGSFEEDWDGDEDYESLDDIEDGGKKKKHSIGTKKVTNKHHLNDQKYPYKAFAN